MIKVYYLKNPQQTRDFHILWEEIINQLKLHPFELVVNDSGKFSVADFENMELWDCEMLVEYNGMFKGISLADYQFKLSEFFIGPAESHLAHLTPRAPHDTLIVAQRGSPYTVLSEERIISQLTCKVIDGIYTPQIPFIDFEPLRNKRKEITEFIDKFVFKGNVGSLPRNVVPYLESSEWYSGTQTYEMMEYLEEVIKHKVGLCIPGAGEICHRDIEYMAMGVPMMKFEYVANLNPPLIPNVHYISIPRIDNHPFLGERSGKQKYADLYIKRFLEVKDDKEFLNFISKNAMEYYDRYLRPSVRVKHIFDLWELPFYEKGSN